MMKVEQHGPPEALVELSEGLPVDAAVRTHVDSCAACSGQVDELRSALELARRSQPAEPDPAYWEEFVPRLRSRIAREQASRRRSLRGWAWPATAAAVVALALAGYLVREVSRTEEAEEVAIEQTLLPPAGEDEDFQVLMALAALADAPEGEDWESFGTELALRVDLSFLSADEQGLLLEKLRRALLENAENGDAKS